MSLSAKDGGKKFRPEPRARCLYYLQRQQGQQPRERASLTHQRVLRRTQHPILMRASVAWKRRMKLFLMLIRTWVISSMVDDWMRRALRPLPLHLQARNQRLH